MDSSVECTIDDLLARARAELVRVPPQELADELAAGALVIDIRPIEQRLRDGELPGALVIDRNVLEWRIAPSSPNRVVDLDQNRKVIVVCNEGYQSSLAAATLRELGVAGATDLIGGYQGLLAIRPKEGSEG
ncbi:MAG: rhodanese-like domain-containing protein [Acidimicrobiia bacterium]